MVHCLRSVTSKIRSAGFASLPSWVSPALLFLEVMAQPMALPVDIDIEEKKGASAVPSTETPSKSNRRDDYEKVSSEHKKQRVALSKTSKRISSVLSPKSKSGNKTADANTLSAFADFPTFAPLISQESADHCLSICLQLLRHQKRQKQSPEADLPSDVAHATILLLTKILYFQKAASRCLRMGGADVLLALHSSSRFKGHVSLVTLTLRRMMEDESTLQAAMEIEIRSLLTKLLKKQGDDDIQGVPGKMFVQAVTPLICRDPVTFLKAAATSIAVKELPSLNEGANFGFYYAPGLNVLENGRTKVIPPAAYISNNYIDKYLDALPWSIIAGPRRGVVGGTGVQGLEFAFDKNDRDNLEPFGINPIVFERGVGLTIKGNKTAQQSIQSALSSAHVREAMIYIEDGLAEILKNYLFEFNNAQTRLEIKTLADSFMESVKKDGGVYDYRNVMDGSNNTNDVIDNNMGILDTFVEPVKGLEILVSRVTILNTGEIATGNFA
jgi:hypothetical protein